MIALISDIHGNLEALEAVLARVPEMEIVCLGDVVCYGADSIECIRRSLAWKSVVAGEFDLAMLNHDPSQWNPKLNNYINNVKHQLSVSPDSKSLNKILRSYGAEFAIDGRRFFHGEPGNVRGFIFPEDVYCREKLDRWVETSEHTFIGGGSHIPGLFRLTEQSWSFVVPENGQPYELSTDEKTIITIGSVGQPRDEDPRAAYAVIDGTSIVFHRVDYDLETASKKIRNDPNTDDMHGDRLSIGR